MSISQTSISELKEKGFKGPDVSLEISLFDYGFAYHENDQDGDLKVLYDCGNDQFSYEFSYAFFDSDLQVKEEFDWVKDWDSFASHFGATFDKWNTYPLWQKIYNLIDYYGYQNICGATYGASFDVRNF